jgi:hypothetical protein
MPQFTQKYTIIQLFENMPVGTQFPASAWPLHSTIADTFAIDWDVLTMINELTNLLSDHEQASSVAEDDTFFGENSEFRVTLLTKTNSLNKIHLDVINVLKKGGWKPNDPQFAEEGFLAHATVQPHARLNKDEQVVFNALSIIDMFPDEDPYQRKVLATIKIG